MKVNFLLSSFFVFTSGLKLNSNVVSNCPSTKDPKVDIKNFSVDVNSATNTINVDLNAQIKETLTSATATLTFSLFGSDLFSLPIDLCTAISGNSACPIPPGGFSRSYSPSIPSSAPDTANIISKIPGSALNAKLAIADASGQALGCFSVGLNDPASAQQPAIIGVTALIAAISAALTLASSLSYAMFSLPASSGQSRPGPSPSFYDVLSTFQFIAISGQLSLNYPDEFQQFTTNFGWSMGVINIPSLQSSLNASRGTALVRRSEFLDSGLIRRSLSSFLPSQNATSYSQLSGVASYSAKLNVSPDNYFITVLSLFAILMGGVTIIVLMLRVLLEVLSKVKPSSFVVLRNQYANYYIGNLLRVFTLLYFVLATAALFQLTLKSDMAYKVIAGIVLGFFCILLMAVVSFLIIRAGPSKLYSEPKYNYRYGSLYSDFRSAAYTYFLVVLVSALARAVAVGGLGEYPWVQIGVLASTEIVSFAALFLCRPHFTSLGNTLMIFIGVIRVTNTGLLFFFIQSFFLPPLARTILSIVIIVLQAIMVLAIVIMTLWGLCITIARLIRGKKAPSNTEMTNTQSRSNTQLPQRSPSLLGSDYLERRETGAPIHYFRPRNSGPFPGGEQNYPNPLAHHYSEPGSPSNLSGNSSIPSPNRSPLGFHVPANQSSSDRLQPSYQPPPNLSLPKDF